jgi:hypothetical protein
MNRSLVSGRLLVLPRARPLTLRIIATGFPPNEVALRTKDRFCFSDFYVGIPIAEKVPAVSCHTNQKWNVKMWSVLDLIFKNSLKLCERCRLILLPCQLASQTNRGIQIRSFMRYRFLDGAIGSSNFE